MNDENQDPEIQEISAKQLKKSPLVDLNFQDDKADYQPINAIKISAPRDMSLDSSCRGIALVEGFTPNATKNLIHVDRTSVYIFSVINEKIKLESSTKFSDELRTKLAESGALDCYLFVGFKGDSIILMAKSLSNLIRLSVDKETGVITDQNQIALPTRISAFAYDYISLNLDFGSKHNKTEILIELKIDSQKAKFFSFDLSNNSFSEVMDAPQPPTQEEGLQSRALEQSQSLKNLLKEFNIRTKTLYYKTKNFKYGIERQDKVLSVAYNNLELIFTLFELKTKKINCKRVITVFELFGDSLEQFLKNARKEGPGPKFSFADYSYTYDPQLFAYRTQSTSPARISLSVESA